MATEAVNRKYRVIQDVMTFEVASATVFNEGDLMYMDTSTGQAKPLDSISAAQYLLGDSQGTQPVSNTNSRRFSGSVSIFVAPHTVKLICAATGTFVHGTPVYYNTDAQSFTLTSGTGAVAIGTMNVSAKEVGTSSGTTVVGKEYEVLLRKSYILNIL